MGDKARAKQLAREAGVPVVPGVEGERPRRSRSSARFGAEHGYPVVIKAVAGGGGKGMRVVRAAAELAPALAAARREAAAAFGDGRVLVERYLERPRHIEVQVLADRHGAVVHLGRARVLAPAPPPEGGRGGAVARRSTPPLRARMGAAAVALARACGYEGAGTVEFIAGGGGEFFFLEMNTRLQVEHPVTELVYGVDLVEQQLRVAAGRAARARARRRCARAGTRSRRGSTPRTRRTGFLPATGDGAALRASRRAGRARGLRHRARAPRSARATTRCWPR